MNQAFLDLIYQAVAYLIAMVLGFFIVNFLSNGFLFKYIKVKASRGSKVLVEIVGVQRSYWKEGKIRTGQLTTKTADGVSMSAPIDNSGVRRLMGVDYVTMDEKTGEILKKDFSGTIIVDPVLHDILLSRSIQRPVIQTIDKELIIMIICIAIALMGMFIIFKVMALEKLILAIPKVAVI
jgi:hypothetical protein